LYNVNFLDPINEYLEENLKPVFIPKYLQEQFQCFVGTHVFINNPWKKVSRKKIIENLQLQKTNSCFWEFRKQIEVKINYCCFLQLKLNKNNTFLLD